MPVSIRPAKADDLAVVMEFNARLALESEGKTLDDSLLKSGVAALLADGRKGVYYLACDGDRILGQVMTTYEWSDWRNGWFWWIQSVYVRPEARRIGVFRTLYEHVFQLAKTDPTVIGLRLYVEENNHRAHATYAKLGMEETPYYVLERFPL